MGAKKGKGTDVLFWLMIGIFIMTMCTFIVLDNTRDRVQELKETIRDDIHYQEIFEKGD